MTKIAIFSGTTEGRELLNYLSVHSLDIFDITVYVATEYGETTANIPNITVKSGRLSENDMKKHFPDYELIIDCTHPYATVVTEQVKRISAESQVEYLRILRENDDISYSENVKLVNSITDMKEVLENTSGNILSTLGSKDLLQFKDCSFTSRLYPRILPMEESLHICKEINIPVSQIIAMQGPFSYEMNKATIKNYNIDTVLSKVTGKNGGFQEKLDICHDLNLNLILLQKPNQVEGLLLLESIHYLKEKYKLDNNSVNTTENQGISTGDDQFETDKTQKITIISCGVGDISYLNTVAKTAINQSEVLLGANRLLDLFPFYSIPKEAIYTSEGLIKYAKDHQNLKNLTVLVTGDSGFFSTAKKIIENWNGPYGIIPGISSINYLAAKCGFTWEDAKIVSLHGRNPNIIEEIKRNTKTFVLFGGENTVSSLVSLCDENRLNVSFCIGENLSYPNEKITIFTGNPPENQSFSPLSCGFVLNSDAISHNYFGLPDDLFSRVEGVPMTKSEVRAISLSKLQLQNDAVVYDIGAGTGSMSVEIANFTPNGQVYSLEQKKSALTVLEENKQNFSINHMKIISGDAFTSLDPLPTPSHVFIGGFSGDLPPLIEKLKQKNQNIRIVINTVTLNTLSQVTSLLPTTVFSEVVEVSVARGEKRGKYHMMLANNPVFVITLQF